MPYPPNARETDLLDSLGDTERFAMPADNRRDSNTERRWDRWRKYRQREIDRDRDKGEEKKKRKKERAATFYTPELYSPVPSASRIPSVFLARDGGGCGDARTRRGDAMRDEVRRDRSRSSLSRASERASNHPSARSRRPSRGSFSLASRARCESPRQAPLLRRASRPEGAHGIERARARGGRAGGGERGGGRGERRCSRTHMSVV